MDKLNSKIQKNSALTTKRSFVELAPGENTVFD